MAADIYMSSLIQRGKDIVRSVARRISNPDLEHTKPQVPTETTNSTTTDGFQMSVAQREPSLKSSQAIKDVENGINYTPKMQETSSILSQEDYKAQQVYLKNKYGLPKMMDDEAEPS